MPVSETRLSTALLIMRLGIAAFFAVWTSLKFYRPEWMANVYKSWVAVDYKALDIAYYAGCLQALIVLLFAIGLFRTPVYGIILAMHATGVMKTLWGGRLLNWTAFPNNLLWTSVATLFALVALFILRHHDGFTVDGLRARKNL